MRLTYDENKRLEVLNSRGLDFQDAMEVFDNFHLTRRDDRNYDEHRFQTVGEMHGQVVLIVWTMRKDDRRIITMWKLNREERERYYRHRDKSR